MKILFLTFDYLTQPLGIASLSAALKLSGHGAEMAALRDIARQETLLREFRPDILCLSLVTGQHPLFIERAGQIRAMHPRIMVLAGGPHATFYPECIEEPCIDAICRGEGETALPALVDAIAQRGALPEKMANWWIKQPDGSISRADVAPLIDNLDRLPFPDRTIFNRAAPDVLPVTVFIMASRGCPYDCSYCFNHAYRELYNGRGRVCRRRSVDNVIEEIKLLRQSCPLQMVVFQDDTFNLDIEWLREFAERYPCEIGLPFHCHLRADLLDSETVKLLRLAGCLSAKLGLEAGREDVRNGILKRGMTLAQFENGCALLRRNGIRFATENILGVPGTTLNDDLFTYEVNRRVKPQHCFASLMQVYPRTHMAHYVLRKGFATSPVTDFPATFYEDSLVKIPDKDKRGRLRAVFAMGVSLNLPVAVVRMLISLPLRKVYEISDRIWKGYCLRFRIYPYKQDINGFIRDLRNYFRVRYY